MTRREFPAAALYEKRGPIAVVSLNRPEVHNAYDVRMRDALYEAFTAVRDDTEVRVLVLRGNGPSFSSGGDLREFGSAPSPLVARSVRRERDVWGVLLGLDALTVAAVHGYVLGGGWEMALLCDVCIASRDARFRFPETGLGLIPGVGGTQTLPRKAGLGYALDWILTGRWLSAEELRRAGLLERVVSRERLDAVALGMARSFARLDRTARRRLKRALRASQDFVGRNASGGTRSVASRGRGTRPSDAVQDRRDRSGTRPRGGTRSVASWGGGTRPSDAVQDRRDRSGTRPRGGTRSVASGGGGTRPPDAVHDRRDRSRTRPRGGTRSVASGGEGTRPSDAVQDRGDRSRTRPRGGTRSVASGGEGTRPSDAVQDRGDRSRTRPRGGTRSVASGGGAGTRRSDVLDDRRCRSRTRGAPW